MITIFENGKYILHLPDWANNVYLKLEELPYKGGLCVLKISYRDKKAYCLYHPTIKRHTLWVDSLHTEPRPFGMYPVGYLRYKSNFEPNYPRSIVCYLDFADLSANIEIPLQEQLW